MRGARLNTALTLSSRGLYLVMPRGTVASGTAQYDSANGYAGVATGKTYTFRLQPTMVTAPTYDSASKRWVDSASISLKFSYDKIPTTPPPPNTNVKTGERDDLTALYALLAVSGVALLWLLASSARRRRRESDAE